MICLISNPEIVSNIFSIIHFLEINSKFKHLFCAYVLLYFSTVFSFPFDIFYSDSQFKNFLYPLLQSLSFLSLSNESTALPPISSLPFSFIASLLSKQTKSCIVPQLKVTNIKVVKIHLRAAQQNGNYEIFKNNAVLMNRKQITFIVKLTKLQQKYFL